MRCEQLHTMLPTFLVKSQRTLRKTVIVKFSCIYCEKEALSRSSYLIGRVTDICLLLLLLLLRQGTLLRFVADAVVPLCYDCSLARVHFSQLCHSILIRSKLRH